MSADSPPAKPPILNFCLAYLKFLMLTKDKLHIISFMCARFSWKDLKRAHELLSNYCNPDVDYNKRGPNSGDRSRAEFFCAESYRILENLDKQDLSPVVAIPSENIGAMLAFNDVHDHKKVDQRFQLIEEKVAKIGTLEATVTGLCETVATLLSGKSLPPLHDPVVLSSEPIRKENTVRRSNPDVLSMPSRNRSDSVASIKRGRPEESDASDIDLGFLEPRYNRRKAEKRLKRSSDNKLLPNKVAPLSDNPIVKPSANRRKANWGKVRNTASTGLTGAIRDLFVFNCSGNPDEKVVKSYLESQSINVTSVEMKSSKEAFKKSFRVSVASHDDYDKLLAGEILPVGTGVKPFIAPRNVHGSQPWKNTLARDNSQVSPNSLNDFIKEGELLKTIVSNAAKPSGLIVSKNISNTSDTITTVCNNG